MKKDLDTKEEVTTSFEIGEGLSLFNPLTDGLGFKDRVAEGVYTAVQVEPETDLASEPELSSEVEEPVTESFNIKPSSDSGTLDIGHEELGDGVLNINQDGEINLKSSETVQPILFHSGHDGLIKKRAKKSGESFFGALIDVMLLFALSILSVAFIAEFTSYGFNIKEALKFSPKEIGKFLLIFSAYFLSYRVLTRVFFGRTLGEWSSRHQLGLILHQHDVTYPFRVLARESVCLGTGVFLFPMISKAIRKDIGFYVSGLQTYVEQKK